MQDFAVLEAQGQTPLASTLSLHLNNLLGKL